MNKFPEIPETHCQGLITIENIPRGPMLNEDLGIQISDDGRVWICINGISFLRFKPKHNIDSYKGKV